MQMLHWLWLSVSVLVVDQFTKQWVDRSLDLHQSVDWLPFLRLTYLRNRGAAFSFLAEAGGWQRWFFIGLAMTASILICRWLIRLGPQQRIEAAAWALILGGALGNLIDRILFGYVIDFIDVYYGDWHWPAFNIADSAITIGVGLLLIDSLRKRDARAPASPR